jgi:hypothetical protein
MWTSSDVERFVREDVFLEGRDGKWEKGDSSFIQEGHASTFLFV